MLRRFKKVIFSSSAFLSGVILSVYINLVTTDGTPAYIYGAFGLLVAVGAYADYKRHQKEEAKQRADDERDNRMAGQVAEIHEKFIAIAEFDLLPKDRMQISSLPDLHPHFVGRTYELALLDTCWQNPSANLLEFVAPGGTGKTTLVTWWLLHRLPELEAQPDAIFAFSFYSQGTGDHRQSSSDQFFSRAADFFELKNLPTDPRERALTLARAIRARRTLFVLDGIEPLQYPPGPLEGQLKDPALRFLLKELAAAQPGLCVCTTRVAIGDLAGIQAPNHQSRAVENLDEAAGVDLLQKIGVRGLEKDLRAAVREYKGHALALRLLGNYLTDILGGDVRQRDRIPHLSDDKTKTGRHARRVMEAYVEWFEANSDRVTQSHPVTKTATSPEVALLHLLGLFDRPAPVCALDALLAEPGIKGLTEGLRGLDETRMRRAFNHLKKLGLFAENPLPPGELPQNLPHLPALRHSESIDAHPLVREHFGERLERDNPAAWREANLRLYEYYRNLPEKHLPDTLEEMEPLFLAMAHGCRGGKQQKALEEVYWERISRKKEFYATARLGAFGSDLTALAHLFDQVWSHPSRNLIEDGQAGVLNMVGFGLRGLGRLADAVEAMKAGLEIRLKQKNWRYAAIDAVNLSELYLTLGRLTQAVKYGQQAVEYADQSHDGLVKEVSRATLANALHQSGQPEEASSWFKEAEVMQRERQPVFRFLYSVNGYEYCDLLLGLGRWKEVSDRAKEGLKVTLNGSRNLLDIALNQLFIGCAHAFAAAKNLKNEHIKGAQHFLNLAVEGLRKAGDSMYLPQGFLTRAAWHRYCGRYAEAYTDLAEVLEIAESGSMGLYLADYHLEMARLARAQGQHEAAELHKAEVLARIRKMGYLRRLKEAEGV